MKKILILGSNGFIGQFFKRHVIKPQFAKEFKYIGVDKDPISDQELKADLTDKIALETIVVEQQPDYIVNVAGLFGSNDLPNLLEVNALISANIFDIMVKRKLKVEKVLITGSAAECGNTIELPIKDDQPSNPLNYYGLSKSIQSQFADYFIKNYDLPIVNARLFNVIGKGMSKLLSIGSFINQINNITTSGIIEVGNLNTRRDFLHIDDVVEAMWLLLIDRKAVGTYNVCSGGSIRIDDILNKLIYYSGKEIKVVVNRGFVKESDVSDSYGDNNKLRHRTQWQNKIDVFNSLYTLLDDGIHE